MAQCIWSLRPGTSRKARVEGWTGLRARASVLAPRALACSSTSRASVWEALLEQCLDKELLVRVYALRALRKMALTRLAAQPFGHRFIIPLMRAFDTDAISLTFLPRMDHRRVQEAKMRRSSRP